MPFAIINVANIANDNVTMNLDCFIVALFSISLLSILVHSPDACYNQNVPS
jgi:hypothetical protein